MDSDRPGMLIVDDDEVFTLVLSKAMDKRGFDVAVAANISQAFDRLADKSYTHIILDLKLGEESGLRALPGIKQRAPDSDVVVLTGYSSIATAVEAMKLGANNYLCKPANADEILAAFGDTPGDAGVAPPDNPPSVNRIEWEHIQKVLGQHNGNISETARSLGMHRRTLQRKLNKRPRRR